MKKQSKPNPRKLRMTQRVTQKNTTKYIIAGSSILGCMVAALIVVNLSNNESTYANQNLSGGAVNYRSVDIHLDHKMLLNPEEINQNNNQEYKGKDTPQNVRILSRATDLVIKNTGTASAE